jgi:4-coumarate--CoA ligase
MPLKRKRIKFLQDLFLGGVVTTANPLYTAEELEHQLTDSGAKYMITIPLFVDKAREAMKNAKLDEKNLYVFGDVAGTKSFLSLVLNDGQVRTTNLTKQSIFLFLVPLKL